MAPPPAIAGERPVATPVVERAFPDPEDGTLEDGVDAKFLMKRASLTGH